ncbi:MAG: hypothetical protein MZU84_07190 [Sphingobacterium sp.]|nr:hypothetical protein [Sphingobacterium sp.]
MKRVTLIFTMIALLVLCGAVYAKDYEISKKAGDLSVQVNIDKNPPVTGINKMTVAIKDAAGKTVTDASGGHRLRHAGDARNGRHELQDAMPH